MILERSCGVVLTQNAVKAVKGMIARKTLGPVALRLSVEGGGCSGLSYKMGFDSEKTPEDVSLEMDGLSILVDIKSAVYLQDVTLDFSDALVGGGFKFTNPSAKTTCGCGHSFSA